MNIDSLKPSYDDVISLNFYRSDIWRIGRDGVPHQLTGGYCGEKLSLLRPVFVAGKYKNRRFTSASVVIDYLGNVQTYDAHYGHYSRDGYTVRHSFDFFGNRSEKDITPAYRV